MKKSDLFVLLVLIALLLAGCNNDPAHVHEWGEWETVIAATCTKDGVAARKCKTCGDLDKETQAIKATGHTYGELQTVPATCKDDGKKYKVCSVCKDEKVEEVLSKSTVDHTWDAGKVTSEPTCKNAGVRTFTCTVCGDKSRTEEVPVDSTKHSYQWITKDDATFLNPKTEKEVCSLCQAESGKTRATEEYKSVEGYWKSQDIAETYTAPVTYTYSMYLSLDNTSSAVLDIFSTISNYGTMGSSADCSYEWTTDEDGKRTEFKLSRGEEGYNLTPSESTDENGKAILTLTVIGTSTLPGDATELTMTRTSTSQHEHKFTLNTYSSSDDDASMHKNNGKTDCGDAHPEVSGLTQFHVYDNTDPDKVELCSVCGAVREYFVTMFDSSDSSDEGYTLEVTKADGIKVGGTYRIKGEDVTIASMKFKDGTEVPLENNTYHPTKDNVEIVYTKSGS